MINMLQLAFDRDIFDVQYYGGIRLYFTQLSRALSADNSFPLRLIQPSLPLDVFPLSLQLQGNVMLKGFRLYALLASFVSSMLPPPPWQPRKVYHATYYRNPLLCWSLNPVVVTVHDMIHECYPQYFDSAYLASIQRYVIAKRRCIFAADAIITVSHSTKADLLRVYPQLESSRVHVIHHGSDHISMISGHTLDELLLPLRVHFRRFLLFVGSRSHYKGFNDLLNAFVEFSRVYSDFGIVCVGKPFTAFEESQIKRLSLIGKVVSATADQSQHVGFYQHAHCLVYPSWREGFGLPILEAMRARCPVLCTDIPSSREIAGRHAMFFQSGDPKDLLARLFDLVEMDSATLGRNLVAALEYASRFTWQAAASRTFDVYLNLLKRSSP